LMQSIKSGKKNMPPFFGILQDPQILDVLAYVRTLR
jgi:cytochrome c6